MTSTSLRQLTAIGLGISATSVVACHGTDVSPPPSEVVLADTAPPAISGGTLLVAADGNHAIAADPDRDRVYVVDLGKQALEREILLQEGDEPGRVAEDGSGRIHVALRKGGAVVTLDPASGEILRRVPVCPSPRGLGYQAEGDVVHVACVDGHLITLAAATGAIVRSVSVADDLRDVVVTSAGLVVTRFRSAELLLLGDDGSIARRVAPPSVQLPSVDFVTGETNSETFEPDVAWRTVARPRGGAIMVHQRAKASKVETTIPGGYGTGTSGGCDSIVRGAVTRFAVSDRALLGPLGQGTLISGVLPVDIAVSADGERMSFALAGSDLVETYTEDLLDQAAVDPGGCGQVDARSIPGTPIALAYAGETLVVQTREPATLALPAGFSDSVRVIPLSSISRRDSGHEMFHQNPAQTLVCASCHPEGREDGRVWNFDPMGPRRTQSVAGGVLATAPLHWSGDIADLDQIMTEVFVNRMSGPPEGPHRTRALKRWLDDNPRLPPLRASDDAAARRGKALFESTAGCADCHSGPRLTNNKNANVGRGEALQVPSLLGVSARAPFMHDGCAATLADRFDPACGGDRHGNTATLSEADRADLVAYLESL